jgi:hypothetical protein
MKNMLGVVLALGAMGLAACSTVEDKLLESGASQVDTAELQKLIGGQTVYGTKSTGGTFVIYFLDYGAMRLSGADGQFQDTGTWSVADSVLCYKWMSPKNNRCKKVFRMKDGKVTYTTVKGEQGFFDRFVKGNAENL